MKVKLIQYCCQIMQAVLFYEWGAGHVECAFILAVYYLVLFGIGLSTGWETEKRAWHRSKYRG